MAIFNLKNILIMFGTLMAIVVGIIGINHILSDDDDDDKDPKDDVSRLMQYYKAVESG